MAPQAWILLFCTLLSVFLQSRGLEFEIVRSPGNFYCARLGCLNDITVDVNSYSTSCLTVYDVNNKGVRTRLAYINLGKPQLVIESSRVKVVNGTGHITKTHVDVTLDFQSDADCLRGYYVCELEYVGVKGRKEYVSETIVPGEQSGECSCSTITEQFSTVTTRSNEVDRQIFTQRQVNGDLNNGIRELRQDLNEKENAVGKLTHDSTLMVEAVNIQIQSDKDIQEEIAAQKRSDELLATEIAALQTNDAKQEKALVEQRAQDEANKAAIADLSQVDRAFEADINVRKRNDAVYSDAISQLKRADNSLEGQIDSVGRTQRSLQEQIITLRQSDNNQANQIKTLKTTSDAQAGSVNQLTRNFNTQVKQISVLREADANFRTRLDGIAQSNTAFDVTILGLRRKSQQYQQDVAAFRHRDQVTENQISLLSATDVRFDQEISALQQVDTVIQQKIDDLTATDTQISREISSLQSRDSAFSVQISVLSKTDVVLQERIRNQSVVYENLQRQVLEVSQRNALLLSRLSELTEKIILFQHYINSSQVTTVVRTTTKLRTVQCTRGMAHTSPRENILVNGVPIICDTETDGGGWLVLQRRTSADVDFARTWNDYKTGFGSITSNYWVGLDAIHYITSLGFNELRVDLKVDGADYFAHYDSFSVGDYDSKYRLSVKGYTGTAGDSLSYHDGVFFSTYDEDHDGDERNCAQIDGGGWWYKDCYRANLDGRYGKDGPDGIIWTSLSETKPATYVEIKVRSIHYEQGQT